MTRQLVFEALDGGRELPVLGEAAGDCPEQHEGPHELTVVLLELGRVGDLLHDDEPGVEEHPEHELVRRRAEAQASRSGGGRQLSKWWAFRTGVRASFSLHQPRGRWLTGSQRVRAVWALTAEGIERWVASPRGPSRLVRLRPCPCRQCRHPPSYQEPSPCWRPPSFSCSCASAALAPS